MSKQDIEKRLGFAAQGVKAEMAARPGAKTTFAEFNVGDKVVATPNNHIDAYGRIIKIENGIATIASAEGNVKAKLSDLELVKKGSVEDLRRLGMKGFARPGVKATMAVVKDLKIKPGKDEDSRFFTASIDGVERQGKVVKDWSRLGGWGWVAYINGVETSAGSQTRKTIQDAIRFASEFIKSSRPGSKAKA